jgi:hypothetical protein
MGTMVFICTGIQAVGPMMLGIMVQLVAVVTAVLSLTYKGVLLQERFAMFLDQTAWNVNLERGKYGQIHNCTGW